MFFFRNGAYEPLVTYPICRPLPSSTLVAIARDAAIDGLHPDQRALLASRSCLLQRAASDEISLLHLDEAIEPRFPDVDLLGNLVTVER